MEPTLHRIRSLYKEMGPAEKKIADGILGNPEGIIRLSITELAESCGCGNAAVVRFSRRVGYGGFQTLKIGIAGELRSTSTINSEVTKTDSCYDIFRKRMDDIAVALENTATVPDAWQLEKAAQTIMKAQRIVLFGLGNSASVAADAAHKLLRVGLYSQACSDNHMQAIIASHLNRSSVAIGISHSGSSTDIVEALRLSKIGGATTSASPTVAYPPLWKPRTSPCSPNPRKPSTPSLP